MKKKLLALLLTISIVLTMCTGVSYADYDIDFSTAVPISCDQEIALTMNVDSASRIFEFTALEDGVYSMYTYNSNFDDYNYVYIDFFTSTEEYMDFNYKWDSESNIYAQCKLEAGEKYYITLHAFSDEVNFNVKLIKIDTPAQSMEIVQGDSLIGYPGDYGQLSVDFMPMISIMEDVAWTSSNESVVNVDEDGYITLGKPGTAVVTAISENNLTASTSIEVLAPGTIVLNEEKTLSIEADAGIGMYEFVPEEDGIYCLYSYDSGETVDPVADVCTGDYSYLESDDDSGDGFNFRLQYEMTAGETYYFKTYLWNSEVVGNYSFKLIKLNKHADSLVINNGEDYVGHVQYSTVLDAVFSPFDSIHEEITWTSSDENVVYVDSDGWIWLESVGEATITATTESGLTDSILVTVGDFIYGDVDMNGEVNAIDAMLVLQYDVELINGENFDFMAADVDGDGEVNAIDAMLILQYDVELIESFPVEGLTA